MMGRGGVMGADRVAGPGAGLAHWRRFDAIGG